MGKTNNHKRRIVLKWIMGCTLLVLLSCSVYFIVKVPTILNNFLCNWVDHTSKGQYKLELSEIRIKPFHRQISFSGVQISPVPKPLSADSIELKAGNYSFFSPKITLKNIHLLQIFFNKDLEIGALTIDQPDLRFPGQETKEMLSAEKLEQSLQQLHTVFQGPIHSLKIHSIEIIGAEYSFAPTQAQTTKAVHPNITFGISQFYTDSTLITDSDRLFSAEDIFISVDNFEKQLSDSLHVFCAKELSYSLKKAEINAQDISLRPHENNIDSGNQYRISVPALKLKSKFIDSFFTSDSISIDSLLLERAEIIFSPGNQIQNSCTEHISDFDVYQLIATDFKSISIRNFILKDARLKLYLPGSDSLVQQSAEQLNLELNDFYLDSVASMNDEKIFYSDQIKISAENYLLNLGDRNHQFSAKHILAHSNDSIIRILDARLLPVNEKKLQQNQKMAMHVKCDSLLFKNTLLKKAFHTRELPIGQIEISHPVITINLYDQNSEKNKVSSRFAYQLISEYLHAIYAQLIVLENGQIEINNRPGGIQTGSIRSDIRFNLTDFALDSLSASKSDKLFFATQIDLKLAQYQMQLLDQLHQLSIDRIQVSSMQKSLEVENLWLRPVSQNNTEQLLKRTGHSELYEVHVPSLWFLNTDIHQAFFKKKLTIDKLRINQPKIDFKSFAKFKNDETNRQSIDEFYDLLSNYFNDISVGRAEAIDGTLKLTNHNRKGKTIDFNNTFQLKVENFRLNREEIGKRKLLFSDDIDLRISKHLFKLSDRVHLLQAGEIGLSTFDSKVYIRNAILYPDITNPESQKLPWNVYIEIPFIQLEEVDLTGLYFDGNLTAKGFEINKPDIKLYRNATSVTDPDIKAITFLLPEQLKKLSIKQTQLHNGQLQLLREIDNKFRPYLETQLSFETKGIEIKNSTKSNTGEITSGEFMARLNKLWLEPRNKNQRIDIGSINYSTLSDDITLSGIQIGPRKTDSSINQYKLSVPTVKLSSFDLDKAYRHSEFEFGQITLQQPAFTIFRNIPDTARFNPFRHHLFRYFKDFAHEFSSRRISLNDASFRVIEKSNERIQSGINLNLSNFRVNSSAQQGFLHSEQFAFTISNITRFDKNRKYQFSAERMGFSSHDNTMVLGNLQVQPLYSKEQFSAIAKHQTDLFSASMQEVRLEQIDLPRWFGKEQLTGRTIRCKNLLLDVYRDKRIPFNEKQRPPMPQELLRQLEFKFLFDSLLLNEGSISYSEQIEGSPSAGVIHFSQVNAQLSPIGNIFTNKQQSIAHLKLNARLMHSPLISAQVQFDMQSLHNEFNIQGSIDSCQLNIFNPMTIPVAQIEINSGFLKKFDFDFTGNNNLAKGKLKFAYEDLNISILEMKDGTSRKSKLSSFMANSLMLRSKNPRGKILLPDEINHKRDPQRSILNYWWKSIFSGVKNTFGIKDKNQAEKQ